MSEERRSFNIQMAQDLGEIKGMLESLAGPQGRVTAIEDAQKTADTRFWIQTAVIIPLMAAFHTTVKRLGL